MRAGGRSRWRAPRHPDRPLPVRSAGWPGRCAARATLIPSYSLPIARLQADKLLSNAMNPAQTLPLTTETFLQSVLALRPRVAAFDCDGTLWSGDAGENFFAWEIEKGVVSPEGARAMHDRYAEYKSGKVSEEDMCGEMVCMHKGLTEAAMMTAAR